MPGVNEQNGAEVDAGEVQAGANAQPNQDIIRALTQLLDLAQRGKLSSLCWVQVTPPTATGSSGFGAFQLGNQALEMFAGLGVLQYGFEHSWFTQISQQMAAMQQRGLQRATVDDLSRLPVRFGRRS